MECINSIGVGTSPSGSAFQSPPHRGMECIGTTSKNSPNATALSVPSSSGNGVHRALVLASGEQGSLSVPSSSGNGVHLLRRRVSVSDQGFQSPPHRGMECITSSKTSFVWRKASFSPLLIGEWSASWLTPFIRIWLFTFSPLLIGEWSASVTIGLYTYASASFQSPPHRGMECIRQHCCTSGTYSAFQSPPHRGMECIQISRRIDERSPTFQSPPHRGMECIGSKVVGALALLALSVPSSSGNGVHPLPKPQKNRALRAPSSS